MPTQFDYPKDDWSTGKMRKVGDAMKLGADIQRKRFGMSPTEEPQDEASKKYEEFKAERKKYWEGLSENQLRDIVRGHVEQNEVHMPMWRSEDYQRLWQEEYNKQSADEENYSLSPKQLREKGF